MAKKFDGTGVVKLQCSDGVYTALKLAQLPSPAELGEVVNGRRIMVRPKGGIGTDGVRYRVVWPELSNGPGSKNKTTSFTLTGSHVNETLYVLAEFLRDQGVDFIQLANKHGSGFSDARLGGTDLAYLSRDIPHSPASHVDFFQTDSPEVGWPSRWVVPASALDGQSN